jgi:hypothetical protein
VTTDDPFVVAVSDATGALVTDHDTARTLVALAYFDYLDGLAGWVLQPQPDGTWELTVPGLTALDLWLGFGDTETRLSLGESVVLTRAE